MRFPLAALLFTAQLLPAQAILFTGGKVWTGDEQRPSATSLLVLGDRVAAVGDEAAVRRRAPPDARVVDLRGRLVLPGIVDAHVHFLNGGDELLAPDLRSARSEQEFAERLAAAAAELPKGGWLTSGSWDHENWPGGALPTKALLDRLVPDHPVFVGRTDGHMAIANSLALGRAVTRDSKDPPGGTIVRAADGEPTGVLKDAAMALVGIRVPPWTNSERRECLLAAMAHAASLGVTSVHDMLDSWPPLATYQELRDEGLLTCRVTVYTPLKDAERWGAVNVRSGFGDGWLKLGGCKGFADGSLGSTTAWFDAPYADAPTSSGLPMPELLGDGMQELLAQCAHLGLQPAIHAIGDRANHAMLDLFSAQGAALRRPRIEHAQHLRPADVARFAQLGVVASMQPYHAIDDGRWAEKRIGAERCRTTYAFHDLLAAGAVLAFGSDWPVVPLSPWLGLDAAVTRRTLDGKHPDGWIPAQKIPLLAALTAYTQGGAFACGDEARLGRLRAGFLADLIVVDRDLFAVPAEQLRDTQVDLTMVGGRVVFERGK